MSVSDCVHIWDIAPTGTAGAFPARCRRCGATKAFPVTPQKVNVKWTDEQRAAIRRNQREPAALEALALSLTYEVR